MSQTTTQNTLAQPATELTRWAEPAVALREKPAGAVRRAAERGMVTAEYAIGILAAIALALTLAKFLTGAEFLTRVTKQVGVLIGQAASSIKAR